MEEIPTINREQAPSTTNQFDFKLIQPEKHELSNGVVVYYIEGGRQDVCRIDAMYKAGNIFESQNLVSSSTNDLLGEGTLKQSALEVNEGFDFYGAYLQRDSSRDYAGMTLFASDEHLGKLLPKFMEVLKESNYSEQEFNLYLKNRKAGFENSLEKVAFVCRNEFAGLLFGSHPYGKPLNLKDFDNVSRSHLLDYYSQYYQSQLPVIFVTGQVSNASKNILHEHFEGLAGEQVSFPDSDFESSKHGATFINHEGAIQSAIRIGRPIVTIEHEDYPALSVTNTILGGYFGSRLMKNIREEKGYTYGIGSGLVSFENNGMWMIATEVGKDVTKDALNEIYKEIKILQNELVDEKELETVKNYMLGNFIKSLDGPFNQADKIKTQVLRKLGTDFYQNQIQQVLLATPEAVRETTQKYFKKEALTELVVGAK